MKKAFIYLPFALLFLLKQGLLAQKPVITSMTPSSGSIGTTVTITGNNFSNSPIVYFGRMKGKVINATATSIQVTVPAGAVSQPISVTANKLIGTSLKTFTVTNNCSGILSSSSYEAVPVNINPGPQVIDGVTTYDGASSNIVTGDIDGDGKTDIVYSGYNGITVMRNTSKGANFSFDEIIISLIRGLYIALGDLDGDGKLDIVINEQVNGNIPDGAQNHFYVYKNTSANGKVSFQSAGKYLNNGHAANKIFISDMDLDGKLDIVTTNIPNPWVTMIYNRIGENFYSIFKNSSPQLFFPIAFDKGVEYSLDHEAPQDPQANYVIQDMTVGDLNLDGKPDIVCLQRKDLKLLPFELALCISQNMSKPGNVNMVYMNRYKVAVDYGNTGQVLISQHIYNDVMPGIVVTQTNYGNNNWQASSCSIYSVHNTTYSVGSLITLGSNSVFPIPQNPYKNPDNFILIDMDGDGYDDLLSYGGYVPDYFANGRRKAFVGFAICHRINGSWEYNDINYKNNSSISPSLISTGDFEGDGTIDIYTSAMYKHKTNVCSSAKKEENGTLELIAKNIIRTNAFQQGNSLDITFSIPQATKATLELYDIAGRKITSLYNGFAEGGKEYKLSYDATSLSKSIYIYKITTDKETISKQIAIVK